MQTNKTMKLSIFVDAEILNISWWNISIYISLHSQSGGNASLPTTWAENQRKKFVIFKIIEKNDEREILILRCN